MPNPSLSAAAPPLDLGRHINSVPYVRERLAPRPGEETYLHLSDLRLALDAVATDRSLTLLDYGCGGSPYRSLFPRADYRRADFLERDGGPLDYRLDESSVVPEKDEVFDFILSTQVLEHVREPGLYLAECHRLLKPAGRLYLTTHGGYPDHGCPHDYRRWTAEGLALDLRRAGFSIERVELMTTGPRFLLQQIDHRIGTLRAPPSLFGFVLFLFRGFVGVARPWLHRMSDRYFAANRVVTAELGQHASYVVVGCLARK